MWVIAGVFLAGVAFVLYSCFVVSGRCSREEETGEKAMTAQDGKV